MPDFVTDADLVRFLPSSGFSSKYIDYACRQGDSPTAYHLINCFGLLAAAAPINLTLQSVVGGTHYANWWGITVGRPGVDHKTSAQGYATELLALANPLRVGSVAGSYEGIVSLLKPPHSTRLCPITEMGHFLSATGSNNHNDYGSKVKPFLTDIFDCRPYHRVVNQKPANIPNPRLSLLAAVNLDLLQTHASPSDWGGGFLSRWCVLHAQTERDDPEDDVIPTPQERDDMVLELRSLINAPVGPCEGMTKDAGALWRAWQSEMRDEAAANVTNAQAAIHGRVSLHAIKMCLLWGFDFGPARDGNAWRISLDLLEPAMEIAKLHRMCMRDLASCAQPTPFLRMRREVMTIIEQAAAADSHRWIPFGEILRSFTMGKQHLVQVLDSIVSEETTLEFDNVGRGAFRLPIPESDQQEYMDPGTLAMLEAAQRRGRYADDES